MNMHVLEFDRPEQNWDILAKVIEKNKKKFLNVISSMGIDIADARIEYNSDGKITEVYTKHYGTDNELRMKEESSGIRKIFNVLPVILEGMRARTLFIVDELDAKLYPALLQSVIALFTDPVINAAGAQMLFTSHDLIIMNSKVFRCDEIWFSAINGYNESVISWRILRKKKIQEKMQQKKSRLGTLHKLPPYTMIICEGVKTEPLYLKGSRLYNFINDTLVSELAVLGQLLRY